MLAALLNVPSSDSDWQRWALDNQDIITRIRQAIQIQSGNVTGVQMTSNGAGYTSAPSVTITDSQGNGSGAIATASYTVSNNEYSISVTVTNGGAGYISPVASFSGGGGTGATADVISSPIVKLTEYQTYPILYNDPEAFQFWLIQNSQAHSDFTSQLNLQSSDLSDVDINNPQQFQAWIYLNYSELRNACFALSIS